MGSSAKKGRGTSTSSPRSCLLAVHLSIEWRRHCCISEDFIKKPPPRRSLKATIRNTSLSCRSFQSDYAQLFQFGIGEEEPPSSSINQVVVSSGRRNEINNTTNCFFFFPTSSLFCSASCFSNKHERKYTILFWGTVGPGTLTASC